MFILPWAFCNFCIFIHPHTVVRRTPVRSSRVFMYVSLSPFLSGRLRRFLVIICAARNFAQRMRLQATVSNPLSVSIICPSFRPSGLLGDFWDFEFVLILSVGIQRCGTFTFSVGVQCHNSFSPHWGPSEPIGVQLSLYVSLNLRTSLYLSGSLYLCPVVYVHFWRSFVRPVIARSACGRKPRGQITWVEVYYVRLSVHLVVRRPFSVFVFVLISSVGVQHHDAFIPSGVQSIL